MRECMSAGMGDSINMIDDNSKKIFMTAMLRHIFRIDCDNRIDFQCRDAQPCVSTKDVI